ncbi:hypothetical protein D9M70_617570 [compost metagenome]
MQAEKRRVGHLEQLGREHRILFDVVGRLEQIDVLLVKGLDQLAHHLGRGRQRIRLLEEFVELHGGLPIGWDFKVRVFVGNTSSRWPWT